MKCSCCGAALTENDRFCPECGTPVSFSPDPETPDLPEQVSEPTDPPQAQPTSAESVPPETPASSNPGVPNAASPSDAPPGPQPDPYPPQNPYVSSQPYSQPQSQPYSNPGMPPYGGQPQVYGGYGAPQPVMTPPKKKKVWPIVLAVCLGAVGVIVIVVILFAVWIGSIIVEDANITSAAQNCSYAIAYADLDTFRDNVLPDAVYQALCASYDVTDEEMEQVFEDYLYTDRMYAASDTHPAANGMEWVEDYFNTNQVFYTHDMTNEQEGACSQILSAYGLSAEKYQLVSLGEDETDEVLCAAQIGEEWYIVDAIMMAEEACRLSFDPAADLRSGTMAYMTAIAQRDTDAMEQLVPEAFWEIAEDYGIGRTDADTYLLPYLQECFTFGTIDTFDCEITEVGWYDIESRDSFQEYYDFGMDYDSAVDLSCSYTCGSGSAQESGEYTVTMVEIDGTWYAVDAMIDYLIAYDEFYGDGSDGGYFDGYDGYDGYDFDGYDYGEEEGIRNVSGTVGQLCMLS